MFLSSWVLRCLSMARTYCSLEVDLFIEFWLISLLGIYTEDTVSSSIIRHFDSLSSGVIQESFYTIIHLTCVHDHK